MLLELNELKEEVEDSHKHSKLELLLELKELELLLQELDELEE